MTNRELQEQLRKYPDDVIIGLTIISLKDPKTSSQGYGQSIAINLGTPKIVTLVGTKIE